MIPLSFAPQQCSARVDHLSDYAYFKCPLQIFKKYYGIFFCEILCDCVICRFKIT